MRRSSRLNTPKAVESPTQHSLGSGIFEVDNPAAIKRLDAAISAIAARVEGNLHDTTEEFANLRANLVGLAPDITATHSTDPRIEVIGSNNKLVSAISALRNQANEISGAIVQASNQSNNIEYTLALLTNQVRGLVDAATSSNPSGTFTPPNPQPFPFTFSQSNAPAYPPLNTIPAPSVARAGSVAHVGPTSYSHPSVITSSAPPTAPPPITIPGVPKAPAPTKRQRVNAPPNDFRVVMGPMVWSQDITSQFLSLLRLTVNARDIPDTGIRAFRTASNHHISVHFPNHMDAITFLNNWTAAPLQVSRW